MFHSNELNIGYALNCLYLKQLYRTTVFCLFWKISQISSHDKLAGSAQQQNLTQHWTLYHVYLLVTRIHTQKYFTLENNSDFILDSKIFYLVENNSDFILDSFFTGNFEANEIKTASGASIGLTSEWLA